MSVSSRLERLASFAPILRNGENAFVIDALVSGSGTDADPYTFGSGLALTDTGAQFVAMAYGAGWVIDFNWMEWVNTADAQHLLVDRAALSAASEEELAKILTSLIRQDRFADGLLAKAFASGLMRAIADRAESLVRLARGT